MQRVCGAVGEYSAVGQAIKCCARELADLHGVDIMNVEIGAEYRYNLVAVAYNILVTMTYRSLFHTRSRSLRSMIASLLLIVTHQLL